jgi:hypothetical protein
MSGLERDVMYKPGATFFKEGKFLMFRYQADSSSVIGPRVATEADKKAHAFEYERYLADAFNDAPLEAFDHDGDGAVGGDWRSLPRAETNQSGGTVLLATKASATDAPKRRGRPPKA